LDAGHNAGSYARPSDDLTSRYGPRLPYPNCLRQFAAPVRLTNVQHGEDGTAACVDPFTVQIEIDAVVSERTKDFEQVPDALARQIDCRGDDHLIDRIKVGQERRPSGTSSPNGRTVIIDVGGHDDAATVLDRLLEDQFR
jgi:hypothetical protein